MYYYLDYLFGLLSFYSAPGKVQNLAASVINSTAISIHWEHLSCINENSVVTGYNVTYSIVLKDDVLEKVGGEMVGRNILTYTATGLIPRTLYLFQVSSVNHQEVNGPSSDVSRETNIFNGNVTLV